MSLSIGLLGKAVAIATAGVGIALPVAKTLSSPIKERVKLTSEEDLKRSCLIVLQGGEGGQPEKQHKKLLACQKDNDPETTEFYFYNSEVPFNVIFLKRVKNIKATTGNTDTVLVFEKDSFEEVTEEVISIFGGLWGPLSGVNLKSETRVDLKEKRIYFQENSQEQYRVLNGWDNR